MKSLIELRVLAFQLKIKKYGSLKKSELLTEIENAPNHVVQNIINPNWFQRNKCILASFIIGSIGLLIGLYFKLNPGNIPPPISESFIFGTNYKLELPYELGIPHHPVEDEGVYELALQKWVLKNLNTIDIFLTFKETNINSINKPSLRLHLEEIIKVDSISFMDYGRNINTGRMWSDKIMIELSGDKEFVIIRLIEFHFKPTHRKMALASLNDLCGLDLVVNTKISPLRYRDMKMKIFGSYLKSSTGTIINFSGSKFDKDDNLVLSTNEKCWWN